MVKVKVKTPVLLGRSFFLVHFAGFGRVEHAGRCKIFIKREFVC